jgi:hypothetical protein
MLDDATGNGVTKVYLDTPYVSVRWEGDRQWVVAEWKAWASSADYRAAQETTLTAVNENQASRFLVDALHARLVLVDDERWVRESLIPRFALTGLRWIAMVMPLNPLAHAILTDVDKTPRNGDTERRYYGNLEEAKAWLSRTKVPIA